MGGFTARLLLTCVLLRPSAAQRRRQPACFRNEPFGFDRHLLFLEIGEKACGLLAPGFGDGVQDFGLGYAAEIILSRRRLRPGPLTSFSILRPLAGRQRAHYRRHTSALVKLYWLSSVSSHI